MATGNANYATDLAATTIEHWGSGKLANAVYDGVPFIKWLRSGGRDKPFSGGKVLLEPVMFEGNNTTQSQTAYQEVNNSVQGGMTNAQFPIALYTNTIVISDLEDSLNSGPEERVDMWEAKVDQAVMGFQVLMNQHAFLDGTASPTDIVGLAAMVDNSGVYGNINRTGNTYWQASEDPDLTPPAVFSEAALRTLVNTVSRQNSRPTVHWTTQALHEAYESLIVPSLRKEMSNSRAGDLGIDYLEYKGAPIFWDANCQAGIWYTLNDQFIKWRTLRGWDFTMGPPRNPTRQLAKQIICKWAGQLTSNNPRFLGKISGRTAA